MTQTVSNPQADALLELTDVTVSRGQKRILDRLSLHVPRFQHTAILGPNGSGKSSLLKVLIRQFYPSVDDGHTGSVTIFGKSHWNIADLRKRLGIVSSELDHEFSQPRSGKMTALQAVLSGFNGVKLMSHIESTDTVSVAKAKASLERVDALQLENQTLVTMSTGERRRVLIARAMIHSPDALVLDEPTTGLDVGARAKFLDTLQTIAATGTTLIFVTHHIEELIPAIHHIIFLKHGKQQQSGTVDELIRDKPLSELFDCGVRVERSIEGHNFSLHVER